MKAGLPAEAREALPDIVKRYLAGESLQAVAPDFNVAARTLYRWLLSGMGEEHYKDLVTDCLTARIADADVALRLADDMCQIARAREEARFARMDFERRRPNLYGQQKEVKIQAPILVQINLRRGGDETKAAIEQSIQTQGTENKDNSY